MKSILVASLVASVGLTTGCSTVNSLLGKKGKSPSSSNTTSSSNSSPSRNAGENTNGEQSPPPAARESVQAKKTLPPLKDEGISNDTHKKFAGQFYFSKKEVGHEPSATGSVKKFTVGKDKLHFRVFLAKSWDNAMRENGYECMHGQEDPKSSIMVSVNGNKEVHLDWKKLHPNNFKKWTSFVPANSRKTVSGPVKDLQSPSYHWASEVLPQLKKGKNTLEFTANGVCFVMNQGQKSVPVATGQIEVMLPSESVRKKWLRKNYNPLKKGKLKVKRLKQQAKKILGQKWPNETVLGAMMQSDNWYKVRHKLSGRVIRKNATAWVVVRRNDEPNKEACRVFEVLFNSEPEGGPLRWGGVGSSHAFPCSRAPK